MVFLRIHIAFTEFKTKTLQSSLISFYSCSISTLLINPVDLHYLIFNSYIFLAPLNSSYSKLPSSLAAYFLTQFFLNTRHWFKNIDLVLSLLVNELKITAHNLAKRINHTLSFAPFFTWPIPLAKMSPSEASLKPQTRFRLLFLWTCSYSIHSFNNHLLDTSLCVRSQKNGNKEIDWKKKITSLLRVYILIWRNEHEWQCVHAYMCRAQHRQ